ncbi:hypothetical protein GOB13_23435 [Sinorhizobium meliloti]|uniref:hypothetical protein n=1 Tax=Rhizobium meliloti TaxID=382 RepID=UPI00299EE5D0|nr:hypothetical protein [Sinorhizobium meliloti]MDX0084241.1 hypothetical protein [Sinorhizobium meliloti]
MSNFTWSKRAASFITGRHPSSALPVSFWDIARLLSSLVFQFAALYFFVGAGLGLWSAYEGNRQAYREYQDHAHSLAKQAAEEIAQRCNLLFEPGQTVHGCLIEAIGAYQAADTSNKDLHAQQEMAYWSFWTFIVSALALFVSTGGLGMLWLSLRQTRQAIGISRDVGHAQVRAYLTVEPGEIADLQLNSRPRVELKIKNTGQSPAKNVKYIATLLLLDHPVPPAQGDLIRPANHQLVRGIELHAGSQFSAEATMAQSLNQGDINSALWVGDRLIYLVCYTHFADVFDRHHVVKTCFYLGNTGLTTTAPDGSDRPAYAWMVAHSHNWST